MSVPGQSERPPVADLLGVVAGLALLAAVVFTPAGDWPPLAVVGVPVVLLVPGYALVAAVFPRAGETAPTAGAPSWMSRLTLSVAGSVVVVAAVGVVLDFSVWGFGRSAVVAGLSSVSLVAVAVAWLRRRRLPAADAAGVSLAAVGGRTRSLAVGESPLGVVLTLLVVATAVGSVAVIAEDTTSPGSVTEFYVLGGAEAGDLVAGAYPSNLTVGEPATVGIGVGASRESGFEGRVVATLERLDVGPNTTRITSSQRLGGFDITVPSGERTVRRHTIQPTMVGDRLRLTYRLYERGVDRPVRRVQVWVSVRPAR